MTEIVQNNLEKLLCDVVVHLSPELLKWEFKDKIDTKGIDKSKLNEYHQLLSNIDHFFKRIIKYELYFAEFYPETDKISKTEALEYHIYSYLEDMDILRNKITAFLGVLKNDLKKITINKKEIDGALTGFIEKVEGTFDSVKKHRHPHHHKGFRFLNSDIIDAQMCAIMLKDDFPLKERVNTEVVKKRENERFDKAKNDYIALSRKNNEQITGLINTIFERNREFVYTVLKIKPFQKVMQ